MMNYVRSKNIGEKYVIYDVGRDQYIQLLFTNEDQVVTLTYVEDVNDASFCNTFDEVSSDLVKAGITMTPDIKIIQVKLTLDAIPDFTRDFMANVKNPDIDTGDEDTDAARVIMKDMQDKIMKERQEMMEQLAKRRQQARDDKINGNYDPTDITSNEFI